MELLGVAGCYLELLGVAWDYLGLLCVAWGCLVLLGVVWGRVGFLGVARGFSELLGVASSCLRSLGVAWSCLGLLMIASSLFIVLISLASGAFINTLRTQRIITNLSESMNNISFAIEQISREVRVGFQFSGGGDTLQFVNSSGDDVIYRLLDNSIERCENLSCKMITTPDVNVDNLEFIFQGEGADDGEPPRVTILISVIGEKDISVNLQTTISSRILNL